MFDCKSCKTLEQEVKFLREQVKAMTDRLVVLANPLALQALNPTMQIAPEDFYGTSSQDEVISYNEYGEKILVKRTEVKQQ